MSEHSPVLLMLAPLFAAVGCALLGLRWKSVAYPITIAGLIAALYFLPSDSSSGGGWT